MHLKRLPPKSFVAAFVLLSQLVAGAAHARPEFADGREIEPTETIFEAESVGGASAASAVGRSTVFVLVGTSIDGSSYFPTATCTGTVISPTIVITAAHCLVPVQKDKKANGISVLLRQKNGTTSTVLMKDFLIYPDYDQTNPGHPQGNDIALVRLQSPINAAVSVPLATEDDFSDGVLLTVAGYGQNGVNGDLNSLLANASFAKNMIVQLKKLPVGAPGVKPKGALISKVAARANSFLLSNSPLLQTTMTGKMLLGSAKGDFLSVASEDSSLCEGDSGGPSYLTIGGRLALVGVHSGSSNVNCKAPVSSFFSTTPYLSVDVYIPNYISWIKAQIKSWNSQEDI